MENSPFVYVQHLENHPFVLVPLLKCHIKLNIWRNKLINVFVTAPENTTKKHKDISLFTLETPHHPFDDRMNSAPQVILSGFFDRTKNIIKIIELCFFKQGFFPGITCFLRNVLLFLIMFCCFGKIKDKYHNWMRTQQKPVLAASKLDLKKSWEMGIYTPREN